MNKKMEYQLFHLRKMIRLAEEIGEDISDIMLGAEEDPLYCCIGPKLLDINVHKGSRKVNGETSSFISIFNKVGDRIITTLEIEKYNTKIFYADYNPKEGSRLWLPKGG
jgi:hypothetical protein